MKMGGTKRGSAIAEAIHGMRYVDRFLNQEKGFTADGAARALATGYAGLCILQEQYKPAFHEVQHYTKDDAYYLLTQGAHEETERVKTSGPSDCVARAVANVDSFLARLNCEVDEEYHASVVQPYMRITEQKRLFEFSLKLLEPWLAAAAKARYGQKAAVSGVRDSEGRPVTAARMKKAESAILANLASVLSNYRKRCEIGGMGIRDQYAADVITSQMPDHIAEKVQEYMAAQNNSQEASGKVKAE